MSYLTDGPDVVLVHGEVGGVDDLGNQVRVPAEAAVKVRGRMTPVSSAEQLASGQAVSTRYRFRCRTFPSGAVGVLRWGGRDFDVVGEPDRTTHPPALARVEVDLLARTIDKLRGAP